MAKKKQENINNDDEEIIEMGPVGRKILSKNFGIYSLALFILFFIILVTSFVWFNFYKIPSYINSKGKNQTDKITEMLISNKQSVLSEINNLKNVIDNYQQEIDLINNRIEKLEKNDINVNIVETRDKFQELEKQADLFSEKLEKLTQSKKSEKSIEIKQKNNFPKIERNIDSNEDNIDVKLKSELLNEFSEIKKSLFNKKVYIDSIEQENQTMFNYLVNFMSGFFNLRDYRDNSNPRAILTKAEMSAKEGNLENLIYNLNKLPAEWKRELEPFLEKCKNFLNKKNNS